jgi:DNA-binding NtrC family response regulator
VSPTTNQPDTPLPFKCSNTRFGHNSLGYDVRVTSDVESFKAAFEGYSPDVVVLDVVMPEVDGIELVKYLAASGCEARILVISGYAQRYLDNTKVLGEAFGLQSITAMSKPIKLPKLEEFLSAV